MDELLEKLRRETREAQEESTTLLAQASAASAKAVRKQKELDNFEERYKRKLLHDLKELDQQPDDLDDIVVSEEDMNELLHGAPDWFANDLVASLDGEILQ